MRIGYQRLPLTQPSVQDPSTFNQLLAAKNRANTGRRRSSVRNTVRGVSEDGRTHRRWGSAISIRRRVGKGEAIRTERIPVDLAEVIADESVALVGILKLQDISRTLSFGDFQRMTSVARWGISLRVSACVRSHGG